MAMVGSSLQSESLFRTARSELDSLVHLTALASIHNGYGGSDLNGADVGPFPYSPIITDIDSPTSMIRRKPSTSILHKPQFSIIMMLMSLMMINIPISTSLITCPSNCSTISPLPYPFGAAPGCGSPGFQLTDCSISTPLWNFTLAGASRSFYIKSIGSNPNSTYPKSDPIPSYSHGGSVVLYRTPNTTVAPRPFCEILPGITDNFTASNLFAFEYADLSYYHNRFFLFNCTEYSSDSQPDSGVLTASSPSCTTFLNHCNLSASTSCLDYTPSKELPLSALMMAYQCSSFKRLVIADENAPASTWLLSATQFAWGPVKYADLCSSCQRSGGSCGYEIQDNSFLCYCTGEAFPTSCKAGKGRLVSIAVGTSAAVVVLFILIGVAFYYRYEWYYGKLFRHERLRLDGIHQTPLEFPYGALAVATKNFSTKIGQGAFGKVYRGTLFDGNEVAVKVLDASVLHTDEQFLNEVATIGNIHHMNVARLVGFCFQKSQRILVYEYVSNSSLDKYLFSTKQADHEVVLNWKQRHHIALGIARGLCYMHEECRNCIIHCDIKPQNILLDTAYCPKISDFGLARLLTREESRVLTRARGTPGYVAPEFWSLGSGPLSAKFDVYSYGVVLLEIIRGKRSFKEFNPFSAEGSEDEVDAWMSVYVDERIEGEADVRQVQVCTLVALWCIQEDPSLRPSMSRVVEYLQGTAPVPDNPPKPFRRIFQHEDSSNIHVSSSELLLSSFEGIAMV